MSVVRPLFVQGGLDRIAELTEVIRTREIKATMTTYAAVLEAMGRQGGSSDTFIRAVMADAAQQVSRERPRWRVSPDSACAGDCGKMTRLQFQRTGREWRNNSCFQDNFETFFQGLDLSAAPFECVMSSESQTFMLKVSCANNTFWFLRDLCCSGLFLVQSNEPFLSLFTGCANG